MVRSYRGKEIDLLALRKQNEKAIALGNAGVNARGDKIGRNGVIEKTREEMIAEYMSKVKKSEGKVSMKEPEPVAKEDKKVDTEEITVATPKKSKAQPTSDEVLEKILKDRQKKAPEVVFDEEETK